MSNISAEEALRKAKEIASKLSGQTLNASVVPPFATGGVVGGGSGIIENASSATDGSPSSNGASSTSGSHKRKRWGIMPEATATTAATTPAALDMALFKRPKTDAAATTIELSIQKRVWVSLDNDKPPAHYVSYMSRHLSEITTKVQEQMKLLQLATTTSTTTSDNGDKTTATATTTTTTTTTTTKKYVELSLQGRGASKEPPIPGMPEQPLHVLIQGTKESVPIAAVLVEQTLLDAQEAPLEEGIELEDNDQDRKLLLSSSSSDPNSALVALSSSSSSSLRPVTSYRPASVAQLIGVHNNVPGLSLDVTSGDLLEEEVQVPHSVVGLIIGRGGESIAHLQAKTGCKVQIQKESELVPGQTHRVITLLSNTQSSIDACKAQIDRLVQERLGSSAALTSNKENASSSSSNKIQEAIAAGHVHLQVPVPEEDVGLIIGKQGSTIRMIQEQTGANIQVPPPSSTSTSPTSTSEPKVRLVDVTHPTREGAQAAQQHIESLLKSKPSNRMAGGGSSANTAAAPQVTIQVSIPDKDVGLCIGRQGCVIRHMQGTSQTRIQIPSHPIPGEQYRIATITGTNEGCQLAKLMIETIVAEQSSATVMSGGPLLGQAGHYYGQQAPVAGQQPTPQQGGYSAEWAAYHAAQAAAAQQQQLQQQAAAPAVQTATTAGAAQPTVAGATSSDAYYEQFFRYAYYYGEVAARQHYGAWAPPVGTPNPYGINPNGIQPAPTADANTAASTNAATVPAATTAHTSTAEIDPLAQATAPPTTTAAYATMPQARETSRRNVSNLPAWMTKG